MTESLQFSMAQREAIVAALGTSAGFVTDFVGALEQVRDLQNVSFTEQVSRLSRFLPAVPEPKRGVREKDIEELKSQAAEADELNRKKTEEVIGGFRRIMLEQIRLTTGVKYNKINIVYRDKRGEVQAYNFDDGAKNPRSMSIDLTNFRLF